MILPQAKRPSGIIKHPITNRVQLEVYWPETNANPMFQITGGWLMEEDLPKLREFLSTLIEELGE